MKGMIRVLGTLAVMVWILGCAPELTPPEEAVRVVGRVVAEETEAAETPAPATTSQDDGAAATTDTGEAEGNGTSANTETPPVPVRIAVHERCSPRFMIFEDCPGKQLGEAKIPKPGPFLIDVDTERKEITVFAWPEGPGVASASCGAVTTSVEDLNEPLQVPLSGSECPRRQPLYY